MKQNLAESLNLIKQDIKKNYIGLFVVLGIFLFMELFYGEVCPLLIWLGIPCPGCGLTRAGILLLKLRFAEAFKMHAFIYPIGAYVLYCLFFRYVKRKKIPYVLQIGIILIAAMVIYYIYRMIRYFPNVEPMMYRQ